MPPRERLPDRATPTSSCSPTSSAWPSRSADGRVLGTVVAVPNYGGGDLLEIAPAGGGADGPPALHGVVRARRSTSPAAPRRRCAGPASRAGRPMRIAEPVLRPATDRRRSGASCGFSPTMRSARPAKSADETLYMAAFEAIARDPNNTLFVIDAGGAVAGCAQLTIIPGLVRRGDDARPDRSGPRRIGPSRRRARALVHGEL